jgi:energy-coupling factor transporter ATP-binding protein EcfA2
MKDASQMNQNQQVKRPLSGKRILVCGKGGSGKSTVVALMAAILQRQAFEVMVLDGDGSNPEGLVRLLFGLGVEGEPKPLIEFFGGLEAVTCAWRIVIQAAIGSWNNPRQCVCQQNWWRSALLMTASPQISDGVSPSSEACTL